MSNATSVTAASGGQVTPVTIVSSGQAMSIADVLAQGAPIVIVASGPATPVRYAVANLVTTPDLTAAYWTKVNLTTPAASQIMETAVTGAHNLQGASGTGYPLAGAHTYYFSVDVTPVGGARYMALVVNSFAAESFTGQFDLQLGTVISSGGTVWTGSSAIIPLGGGAYRASISINATLAGTTGLNIFIDILGGLGVFSYLGTITNGLILNNITFNQTS